jgi:hypothetical protein
MPEDEITSAYAKLPDEFRAALDASYAGKTFLLGQWGKITYTPLELGRLSLCYGEAISYLQYVHSAYLKGAPWPIDLSVDLGELSPHAHYLIGTELNRAGVRLSAVGIGHAAPSFMANVAIAGALGHKLRIVLNDGAQNLLWNREMSDKCLFDLRRPPGSALLAARAVLSEAGVSLPDETAKIGSLGKAALREALRGYENRYISLMSARLEKEKSLMQKLLGGRE